MEVRMKRNVATFTGLALLAVTLGACGGEAGNTATAGNGECAEQTVKLAHKYPTTHFFHELAEGLADEVSTATDGRVTIDIYPAEQLIPEAEEVASTASGAVQITMPSSSEFHDYDIPAEITSLPFAVNGFDESRELRGSKFEELFAEMIEDVETVEVQGFVEGAGVDILATTVPPLKSPSDFKGLKLRANNASVAALFEAYGSPALTQPVADVYTSLERGTIDGAVTIPTSLVAGKWYEAAPNITVTPGSLGYAFYPIVTNREWYNGLCDEDQAVFDTAFDNMVSTGQDLAEEAYTDSIEFLEGSDGVTVYKVPAEERSGWAEPGEFLYEEFLEKWGDRGQELLDAYTSVSQ
jgi:TRAP-type C4-dicarboxylate transport system substrate-binding protein